MYTFYVLYFSQQLYNCIYTFKFIFYRSLSGTRTETATPSVLPQISQAILSLFIVYTSSIFYTFKFVLRYIRQKYGLLGSFSKFVFYMYQLVYIYEIMGNIDKHILFEI